MVTAKIQTINRMSYLVIQSLYYYAKAAQHNQRIHNLERTRTTQTETAQTSAERQFFPDPDRDPERTPGSKR